MIIILALIAAGSFVYWVIGNCVYAMFERKYFALYGRRFNDYTPYGTQVERKNYLAWAIVCSTVWPLYPAFLLVKYFFKLLLSISLNGALYGLNKTAALRDKIVLYESSGASDENANSGSPYREK